MTTAAPNPPAPAPGPVSKPVGAVLGLLGGPAVWVSAVVGALISLTAVGVLGLALMEGELTIALFQAVVVGSGMIPAGLALGRFREAPGLALLCASAAPIVASVLSEPTIITGFLGAEGEPVRLGPLALFPVMLGHLLGGLVIAGSSAVRVWSSSPGASAAYLVRSAATGIPLVALVAVFVVGPGGGLVGGLPAVVKAVLAIAAFFVGLALVSISGHCLIRSFEVGVKPVEGSGASGGTIPEHAPTA